MGGEAGLSLSHLCASVPLTMTSFARRSRVPLVFTGFGLLKTWNRKLKYGGEFSWNSTSNSGKVSWGGILVCYWQGSYFYSFFFLRRKNSSSTCPFHQADPDSSVLGWGEQALLALDCRCRKRRGRGSREVDEQRGIYDSVEISELEQASWGKGRADYKKPNSATLWELFKYLPPWQLFNCAIVTMYF